LTRYLRSVLWPAVFWGLAAGGTSLAAGALYEGSLPAALLLHVYKCSACLAALIFFFVCVVLTIKRMRRHQL